MRYLYLATTFAAAVVMLLTSLLIFARRKGGERSRATALRNFKQYTGKTPSEYFPN